MKVIYPPYIYDKIFAASDFYMDLITPFKCAILFYLEQKAIWNKIFLKSRYAK